MKKYAIAAAILAALFYQQQFLSFPYERAALFVDRLGDDVNGGRTHAACSQISDKIVFSYEDASVEPPRRASGGKAEICDHFAGIARYYETAPIADRHYKNSVHITRAPGHSRRADLAYTEHHEIEYFPSREKVNTRSDEEMTIERTMTGFLVTRWIVRVTRVSP